MWARVKEESKKGKQKWRVGDLLADDRRSPAVLDSLRVGRAAPPVEEIGIVRALRRNQRGGVARALLPSPLLGARAPGRDGR